jgi:hypothetical protein
MKSIFKIISISMGTLVLLMLTTTARSTSTEVVLNLEGNPTCSSLGDNHTVLEYRVGTPGNGGTIYLPTTSGGEQAITYTVGLDSEDNAEVSWDITMVNNIPVTVPHELGVDDPVNPINYVILKGKGNKVGARVFHFGTSSIDKGAISDSEESAPGPTLSSISFCYGLTEGANPVSVDPGPINLANLPRCEDLPLTTGQTLAAPDLYTTGIICPKSSLDGLPGEEQLMINMALNDANFGFGADSIRACTCNVPETAPLRACNPELAAQKVNSLGEYFEDDGITLILDDDGERITTASLTSETRSCMEYSADGGGAGVPTGVNERVPFSIQGVENPDSYICYTWGGTRYCYGHY